MEKKPQVFPEKSEKNEKSFTEMMKEANETGTKIAEQAIKEEAIFPSQKSKGELEAMAKMKADSLANLERQLKERDELVRRKKLEAQGIDPDAVDAETSQTFPTDPIYQPKAQVIYPSQTKKKEEKVTMTEEEIYKLLSRKLENDHYDMIPLPSEGKLYKNGKKTIKVGYLNASDENIITNPNLLQSGKFLEVLINRKLLDTDLEYKDLHVGDRNAIMIWLRSTGFGPMYKITLSDPNAEVYTEFEADVDLSKLAVKNLGAEPDENCLFTYKLPVSGDEIKFRMLTVGDVEDVEDHLEKILESTGSQFTDASTYSLKKQIVEVNGNSDVDVVTKYVERMRIGDVRSFRTYVNDIESGIDMNLTVRTPGGGSVDTFLPLNLTFFWPDLRI